MAKFETVLAEQMKTTGLTKAETIHLLGLKAGNLRTVRGASYVVGSTKGGITIAKDSDLELLPMWEDIMKAAVTAKLRYTPGSLSKDSTGSKSLADGLRGIAPLKPKPVKEEAKAETKEVKAA